VRHEPAVRVAGMADARSIDCRVAPNHVVDPGDDVLAVFVAPRAPRRPLERLAVARRAPEVRIEDEVAVRGEELLLEIERVARGRMRAAVAEDDERIAACWIEGGGEGEPAFDARAVLARPLQPLGLAKPSRREERGVDARELPFTGPVDIRRVQLARLIVRRDRIGDPLPRAIECEAADAPLTPGHLLDFARRCRHAKQLRLAADRGCEVDEPAIRRPRCRAWLQIPFSGEVDRRARSVRRPYEKVARSAMIQLLVDDLVRAERARVGEVLAVR